MGMKQFIKRMIPSFIQKRIRLHKEVKQLKSLQRAKCKPDNLRHKRDLLLSDILHSREIDCMWLESEKEIKQFDIPDGTGGVNPGDRRAVYYLTSAIEPTTVLEIGTHIGASTIHIASAISKHIANNAKIITVDIADVNSRVEKPWLKYGTTHSPIEMVDKLGYKSLVEFITDNSLHFADNCQRKFDCVFLDGDHSAATVYQEVPVALDLLKDNGVILLHDYFPNMKPLWNNGSVIPGPYLAIERLRREGLNVTVLPLGKLPWPTKLQSNVTSLALLLRND